MLERPCGILEESTMTTQDFLSRCAKLAGVCGEPNWEMPDDEVDVALWEKHLREWLAARLVYLVLSREAGGKWQAFRINKRGYTDTAIIAMLDYQDALLAAVEAVGKEK
jgi:hypothetical protein